MKNFLFFKYFLFSLLLLIFVFANTTNVLADNDYPHLTIGLVTPLTGPVADLGKEMLSSAQIAITLARNIYPNLHVNLIPKDDQMSAVTAATAVKGLISQDNADVVIAAGTSSVAKGQIEALKGFSIPLVTSTATASSLTRGKDNVFRVIPPNAAQGKALSDFAIDQLKKKTAAVLFQQDDYSIDLKNAFVESFSAAGGKVLMSLGFEEDETDFRMHLNVIKDSGAEVLVCPAQHVQIARLLKRIQSNNLNKPVLSGDTAYTEKLLEVAGTAAEGFYLIGPDIDFGNPSTKLASFVSAFEEKNGRKPGIYACYTYDAVNLLIYTKISMKSSDTKFVSQLRSINDFVGATGRIEFDEEGNVKKNYKIYRVNNNEFKRVN